MKTVELWDASRWRNHAVKVLPVYTEWTFTSRYTTLKEFRDPCKLFAECIRCADETTLPDGDVHEQLFEWGDFSSGAMCQVRAAFIAEFGEDAIKGDPYFMRFLYYLGEMTVDCKNIGCGIAGFPKTGLKRLQDAIGEKPQKIKASKYMRGAIEAMVNARMFMAYGIPFESLTWVKSINGTRTCVTDFYTSIDTCMVQPLMNGQVKCAILLLETAAELNDSSEPGTCVLIGVKCFYPFGIPTEKEPFVAVEMYSAHHDLKGQRACKEARRLLGNPKDFQEVSRMIAAFHQQFPGRDGQGLTSYIIKAMKSRIGLTKLNRRVCGKERTVLFKEDKYIALNMEHIYATNRKGFFARQKNFEKFVETRSRTSRNSV